MTSLEITVRSSPDGLERLQQLVGAGRFDTGEGIVDIRAPPDGSYIVAASDGDPVGCATIGFFDAGSCELYRLFVDPACRRGGIGTALVEEAEHVARERQVEELLIELAGSRPFWLKHLHNRLTTWISDRHVSIDLRSF